MLTRTTSEINQIFRFYVVAARSAGGAGATGARGKGKRRTDPRPA
jgi:hypothetical protein